MPAPTRVYLVTDKSGEMKRLVRAQLPSQAVRHVVGDLYQAKVPSQAELIAAIKGGIEEEVAGAE